MGLLLNLERGQGGYSAPSWQYGGLVLLLEPAQEYSRPFFILKMKMEGTSDTNLSVFPPMNGASSHGH
jgi:hypothetical protein